MDFIIFAYECPRCEECTPHNTEADPVETPHVEINIDSNVNHPSHYTQGEYEVIDVIEDWNLGFHLSNALKYIARANHKGQKEEDLKKAIWYIQRELGLNKSERNSD